MTLPRRRRHKIFPAAAPLPFLRRERERKKLRNGRIKQFCLDFALSREFNAGFSLFGMGFLAKVSSLALFVQRVYEGNTFVDRVTGKFSNGIVCWSVMKE